MLVGSYSHHTAFKTYKMHTGSDVQIFKRAPAPLLRLAPLLHVWSVSSLDRTLLQKNLPMGLRTNIVKLSFSSISPCSEQTGTLSKV